MRQTLALAIKDISPGLYSLNSLFEPVSILIVISAPLVEIGNPVAVSKQAIKADVEGVPVSLYKTMYDTVEPLVTAEKVTSAQVATPAEVDLLASV